MAVWVRRGRFPCFSDNEKRVDSPSVVGLQIWRLSSELKCIVTHVAARGFAKMSIEMINLVFSRLCCWEGDGVYLAGSSQIFTAGVGRGSEFIE